MSICRFMYTGFSAGPAMLWYNLWHRGVRLDKPGNLASKQVVKLQASFYYSLFGHLFKKSKTERTAILDLGTQRGISLYKKLMMPQDRDILEAQGAVTSRPASMLMWPARKLFPLKVKTVLKAEIMSKTEILQQIKSQEMTQAGVKKDG